MDSVLNFVTEINFQSTFFPETVMYYLLSLRGCFFHSLSSWQKLKFIRKKGWRWLSRDHIMTTCQLLTPNLTLLKSRKFYGDSLGDYSERRRENNFAFCACPNFGSWIYLIFSVRTLEKEALCSPYKQLLNGFGSFWPDSEQKRKECGSTCFKRRFLPMELLVNKEPIM